MPFVSYADDSGRKRDATPVRTMIVLTILILPSLNPLPKQESNQLWGISPTPPVLLPIWRSQSERLVSLSLKEIRTLWTRSSEQPGMRRSQNIRCEGTWSEADIVKHPPEYRYTDETGQPVLSPMLVAVLSASIIFSMNNKRGCLKDRGGRCACGHSTCLKNEQPLGVSAKHDEPALAKTTTRIETLVALSNRLMQQKCHVCTLMARILLDTRGCNPDLRRCIARSAPSASAESETPQAA